MTGSPATRAGPALASISPPPEPAESSALRTQANQLYRAGNYADAIRMYRTGAEQARARGDARSELRFRNNLGGAEYKSFRYRDAIRSFLRARDLATANRELDTLAAACTNLSSLYLEMDDLDGALQSAREGTALPAQITRRYRAQLLMQAAYIRARQNNVNGAVDLEHQAIEASRDQNDVALESQAWNELGAILLDAKRPADAEPAILEGYRLRRLHLPDLMTNSYLLLGRLKVQQGDPAGAEVFFGHAIKAARELEPPALGTGYFERSRALVAQSRWKDAYQDLRAALQYLQRWRSEVLPADAFRVSAEGGVQEIYSAFIDVAAHLYRDTGNRQFAEEALAASETNRASSLRALWTGGDLTASLPPEYGETLAELRRTEGDLLRDESAARARDAARLRLRLAEMETRAGLDMGPAAQAGEPSGRTLIAEVQQTLGPQDLLLAFHSGEAGFYCWAVTRERLQFSALPDAATLPKTVQRFVDEIRENRPPASATSAAIYRQLFAGVDATLLAKAAWIVAPDGPLFELPFSALIESATGAYVVEHHDIREVPGLWALRDSTSTRPPAGARLTDRRAKPTHDRASDPIRANPTHDRNTDPTLANPTHDQPLPTNRDSNPSRDRKGALSFGPWLALGDPIYNRADARTPRSSPKPTREPIELARLTGSGREVDACARIWRARGLEATLLKGAEANRRNLLAAIANGPPVIHIATHILFPPNRPGPGMLALSQEPAGGVDLLSASEIARLRARLDLVVLDGCSSGTGPVLPGTGLMGLTRAWLAAGARAIVVTRWPAADRDAGALFQAFYENLPPAHTPERVSFSRVLQQAQVARLREGGPGANPANWASYFCVERN